MRQSSKNMGSNETPRSMPLVYTVCCGATRSGGMIYVENGGVNMPCERGHSAWERLDTGALFPQDIQGQAVSACLRQVVQMRHLISYLQRRIAIRVFVPMP